MYRLGDFRSGKSFKGEMEALSTSDIVIIHGNSHPELANLIAGFVL